LDSHLNCTCSETPGITVAISGYTTGVFFSFMSNTVEKTMNAAEIFALSIMLAAMSHLLLEAHGLDPDATIRVDRVDGSGDDRVDRAGGLDDRVIVEHVAVLADVGGHDRVRAGRVELEDAGGDLR